MKVFIDASAMVSLIAPEAAALALSDRLELATACFSSEMSVREAVAGLQRTHGFMVDVARNGGGCVAYACAKANGAALLFKGEDFGLTDILAA